jgi:hypothetical protein
LMARYALLCQVHEANSPKNLLARFM